MTNFNFSLGLILESLRLVVLFSLWWLLPSEWTAGTARPVITLAITFPQSIFLFFWTVLKIPTLPSWVHRGFITLRWGLFAGATALALKLVFRPFVNPFEGLIQPEFLLSFLLATLDLIIIVLLKSQLQKDVQDEREL